MCGGFLFFAKILVSDNVVECTTERGATAQKKGKLEMKEKFDYTDLKDMAETFANDNESLALRIEVIKEICELPDVNIKWAKLDIKHLKYYAENPEHLPGDPKMFKIVLTREAKEYGVYLTENKTA